MSETQEPPEEGRTAARDRGAPSDDVTTAASATVVTKGDEVHVALSGRITIQDVDELREAFSRISRTDKVVVDLGDVEAFDTAGAWLVAGLGPSERVSVMGASAAQDRLIETVRRSMADSSGPGELRGEPRSPLERLGRWTVARAVTSIEALNFFGLVLARTGRLLIRPWRFRLTPLVHQMQAAGLDAVPIVSVMAFLIGVVLAFQGAAQLRQFGADVFVVELIAISILRELGVLMTAIVVAGRTGAAFTSAIGSMKMREEVDAMRTLGLDPVDLLVVPRVLALVLTLPILTFVADIAGLLGGALMSWIELGVSPAAFRTRLGETVDVWNYAVGLIKAPFFALIIAMVGCHQGFSVGGNAESLGRLTSRSVVISIFAVIVVDALFSIFFELVGV